MGWFSKTRSEDEDTPSLPGRILRTIGYILLLSLYLFFFWRMCTSGDTDLAKTYLWTDAARAAQETEGFSVCTPTAENAKMRDSDQNGFMFRVSSIYYTPCISQLQFTMRYNDSMLELVAEKYDLDTPPTDEAFAFVLTDNLGNVYADYTYLSDERNVNNYRRLVFEGLSFEEEVTQFFIHVYYVGDVCIGKTALVKDVPVWTVGQQTESVEYGEPVRHALNERPDLIITQP